MMKSLIVVYFKRFLMMSLIATSFLYVKNVLATDGSEFFFPKAEYDHYMKLMSEIDPYVHEQLKASHKEIGSPFIERDEGNDRIEHRKEDTYGYPIIFLSSMLDKPECEQKAILSFYAQKYRLLDQHATPEERRYILELMRLIDPSLYDAIVEVDPTGINHILWSDFFGISLTSSDIDGLPIILIDRHTLAHLNPYEQQAFLAHELGHYVLKHLQRAQTPSHDYFFERASDNRSFAKGKKVAGQLAPYETFRLAAERIQEHEADRSAILDFGIDIDIMLSAARKIIDLSAQLGDIDGPTFQRTHPLWVDRIKHLESLRSEVELRTAKQEPLKRFDWKMLAKEYTTY